GRRARGEVLARPEAGRVVAPAARRREPAAVVREDSLTLALRIVEGHETYARLLLLGQRLDDTLEVVQIVDGRRADARDDRAAGHRRLAEDVARIRDEHALHGPIEMPRLLIR